LTDGRTEVLEAWGDWIATAASWDWFVTGTFAPPGRKGSDEPARAEARERARGHTSVGYSLSDRRWREWIAHQEARQPMEPVYWLRAREPHQFSRSTHFHALVGGVGNLSRRDAFGDWLRENGQARIVPVARDFDTGEAVGSRLAVARYVCKYVLKQQGEVVFSENAAQFFKR